MQIQKVLQEQRKLLEVDSNILGSLKKETEKVVDILKSEVKENKVDAEIFVGGSFAKGTLIKKDRYDVDIYAMFNWKTEDISSVLEKIVEKVSKTLRYKLKKIHGSRDYFSLENKNMEFELIPVHKIKRPREARNVTDLSFFHVNYVKKKTKTTGLIREIRLAKKFFQAQKVYGAESYISGFSGYGIECLMIHYKSFLRLLKELSKVEDGERVILDPEKLFKKKSDILFELNESKIQSPIILVDPTWKERNVLAALSKEVFGEFQASVKKFLNAPSGKFFELEPLNLSDFKKSKGEFLHVKIKTDRQEGDIAGTKMRKFSKHIEKELRKYFDVLKKEFEYKQGKNADFYLVVKGKKEVVKLGPPVKMKANAKAFKKKNKKVVVKSGRLYSREKVKFTGKEFLEKWITQYGVKMKEMGIVGLDVLD